MRCASTAESSSVTPFHGHSSTVAPRICSSDEHTFLRNASTRFASKMAFRAASRSCVPEMANANKSRGSRAEVATFSRSSKGRSSSSLTSSCCDTGSHNVFSFLVSSPTSSAICSCTGGRSGERGQLSAKRQRAHQLAFARRFEKKMCWLAASEVLPSLNMSTDEACRFDESSLAPGIEPFCGGRSVRSMQMGDFLFSRALRLCPWRPAQR